MAASSRAACRAATMSASRWIGIADLVVAAAGLARSSGSLSRAHRSHSSRCRAASTSRCRRRSPPDSANSTGRHRSVGGSARSRASRYSTRSRARVRLSWAATAPAVEPSSAARTAVSCPATSCASSVCRSRSASRPSAWATAACSSSREQLARPGASRVAGRRPGAGCAGAGRASRHIVATTLRAVTMAYGSSIPGSMRLAAASTRTSVSWTRSSAAGWADAREDDASHHRHQGGDVGARLGRAPSSSAPPMAGTLRGPAPRWWRPGSTLPPTSARSIGRRPTGVPEAAGDPPART